MDTPNISCPADAVPAATSNTNSPAAPHSGGLLRWLLHEAVRANPLYVISAALLAYAVREFMVEIDPQIGKLGGVIESLVLLHVYEIAVLVVATVVLKRRARGGLDMHGLLIVAAIYMGVTYIALDELVTIRPWLGLAVAVAGLAATAIKLAWYARLPGVCLSARYRWVVLLVLGAHELSPILNSREISEALPPVVAQGLGWMAGWISLSSILWLIHVETLGGPSHAENTPIPDDPLATRMCGAWAVCLAATAGITHIFVSDWIFDRTTDNARIAPAAMVLAAAIVLLRWRKNCIFGFFDGIVVAAPILIIEEIWRALAADEIRLSWEFLLSSAMQVRFASAVFYCALARGTGRALFYTGLGGPLLVPYCVTAWRSRESTPHFRAMLATCLGFASLALGMLVSLFREKLLRRFSPRI